MAWPVAGGRDGQQATETAHGIALRGCPPQLRDLLPGAGAYWVCATLSSSYWALPCLLDEGVFFFFALLGGAVAPAGPPGSAVVDDVSNFLKREDGECHKI